MKRIGEDFQGWPIKAMTLREIIDALDLTYTTDDGMEVLRSEKTDILNSYPVVLEDDGMGYGVNPRYVIETNDKFYDNKELGEKTFNIFAEPISDVKS